MVSRNKLRAGALVALLTAAPQANGEWQVRRRPRSPSASTAAAPAPDFSAELADARERDAVPALVARLEAQLARRPANAIAVAQALAEARAEVGDPAGAVAAERQAFAQSGGSFAAARRLIGRLDALGRSKEADAVWQELVRREPWNVEVLRGFLIRQRQHGRPADAERGFDGALRRFARDPAALGQLADLATTWGDENRALAAWDATLARAPRDKAALTGVGEVHFLRGRRELARQTWAKLLQGTGTAIEPRLQLGELLVDHGLLREAGEQAEAARQLAPSRPEPYRLRAQIAERELRRSAAIAAWEQVVTLATAADQASLRRQARARLAALYYEEGRFRLEREAAAARDRLTTVQPRSAQGRREELLFAVELERRLDRPDRAIALLSNAADGDPGDADVAGPLVRLLRATRQMQEAVQRLETLATHNPARAGDARAEAAGLELTRGQLSAAERLATQAASDANTSADGLARAADVLERVGRPEAAQTTLRRVLAREPSGRVAVALLRLGAGAATHADRDIDTQAAVREAARRAEDPGVRHDLLQALFAHAEATATLASLAPLITESRGGDGGLSAAGADDLRLLWPLLEALAASPEACGRDALSRLAARPLLGALAGTLTEVDARAITWVGRLGRREAVPLLAQLIEPSEVRVAPSSPVVAPSRRLEALVATALGRIGTEEARPALARLLTSPDDEVRASALWAWARLPGTDPAPLLEGARSAREAVAAAACLALRRHAGTATLGTLSRIVTDTRRPPLVRSAAALALGGGAGGDLLASLAASLQTDDPELALAVHTALAMADTPRTRAALIEGALWGRGWAQWQARAALAKLGAPVLEDDFDGLYAPATAAAQVRRLTEPVRIAMATPDDPDSGQGRARLWIERSDEILSALQGATERADARDELWAQLVADDTGTWLSFGRFTGPAAGQAQRQVAEAAGAVLSPTLRASLLEAAPAPRLVLLVRAAGKLPGAAGWLREGWVAGRIADALGPTAHDQTAPPGAAERDLFRTLDRALGQGLPATLVRAALVTPLSSADPEVRRLACAAVARLGSGGLRTLRDGPHSAVATCAPADGPNPAPPFAY